MTPGAFPPIAHDPPHRSPEPLDCAMGTGSNQRNPIRCCRFSSSGAPRRWPRRSLWVRSLGAVGDRRGPKARCAALVSRAPHSPFYRELGAISRCPLKLAELPVVTKRAPMTSFDAWCTIVGVALRDRGLSRNAAISASASSAVTWCGPAREPSETRHIRAGRRGARRLRRAGHAQLAGSDSRGATGRPAGQGGRAALITADADHFASIASWRRVAAANPGSTCEVSRSPPRWRTSSRPQRLPARVRLELSHDARRCWPRTGCGAAGHPPCRPVGRRRRIDGARAGEIEPAFGARCRTSTARRNA